MNENKLPWFHEGLRFKCTGCGKCCTGGPGIVEISQDEIEEAAEYLKISANDFKKKYVKSRDNKYQLIQLKSQNNNCIFLKDNKCEIYTKRPQQCRTFPWWKENLNTLESWKEAAKECEGISEEAPLISYDEIIGNLNS